MKRIGITTIFIICYCVLSTGCTQKTNKNNNVKQNAMVNTGKDTLLINLIKNIERIERENADNEYEVDDDSEGTFVTEDYIEALAPHVWDGLKKSGFKEIDDKEFKKKIETVFGVSDKACKYKKRIIEHEGFYSCSPNDEGFSHYEDDKGNDVCEEFVWGGNVYLFKKYHCLLNTTDIMSIVKLEGNTIKSNLDKSIIYANLYVFNDSKAALTWLMANDGDFLNPLVKTFGYMGDKRLLEWVAKTNQYVFAYTCRRQSFLDFSPVLFNYDLDGTYHFHQEMLDVMAEALPDDKTYLFELGGYLNYLRIDPGEEEPLAPKVFRNFADQAETVARICYWGEKLVRTHHLKLYDRSFLWLFSSTVQDMYDAEFKRRNYYGLDGFEELWEESKKQVEEENKQRPQEVEIG